MLNLDTHVLLFALNGQLKAKERRLLEASPWSISAIVLWEISKLAQLERIELDLEADQTKGTRLAFTLSSLATCKSQSRPLNSRIPSILVSLVDVEAP